MMNDENSPVACMTHLLVILLKLPKNNKNQNNMVNYWKEMVLHYMTNLAAIPSFCKYFTQKLRMKKLHCNQSIQTPAPMIVFLALIKSFHSETKCCRLLTMNTIQNIVLESYENQNMLIQLGGVESFLNLCTSHNALLSTPRMKSKACELLTHCVTNHESKENGMRALLSCPDAFEKLMKSFTRIVSQPSFLDNELSMTNNEMEHTIFANL